VYNIASLEIVILCILHHISTFSDEGKSWYSKGRGKRIFSHCQKELTYTALPLKHLAPKGRGQNLPRIKTHSVITKRKSKAEKRELYIQAKTNR
jgi:hypothetical protein